MRIGPSSLCSAGVSVHSSDTASKVGNVIDMNQNQIPRVATCCHWHCNSASNTTWTVIVSDNAASIRAVISIVWIKLNCQIIVDNSQHDHVSQMWSCQPVQRVSLSLSLMWECASRAGGMSTMMPPAMPLTSWSSQRRKRNQKPCALPEDWIYCHTVAWLPASQPLAAPRNQCMGQIRSGSAAIVWDSRSRSATHMHWSRRAVGGTVKAQPMSDNVIDIDISATGVSWDQL